MDWTEETLEDYIDITHGFAFKGEHFAPTGEYVILTPGNIHLEGGLKLTAKDKSYRGEFPPSYLFEKGDLVVVMTDLIQDAPILGGAFFIPESNRFLHNQRLGKVAIKGEVEKLFLYYYFNSEYYRGQVRGTATGATVRHTAPERIYQCKIKLPPIPVQRRIAEILGRYDALIGNYQRQVATLESSALALYREWFVRGRCLYARNKESGLPVGWQRVRVGDVLDLKYGKSLPEEVRAGGRFPVVGSSGVVGFHDKCLVDRAGIVVGRKGNVGSVFWIDKPFFPIDTAFYVESGMSGYYLFFNLKTQNFISGDAAVPGLNRMQALSNEIVKPSDEVLAEFDRLMDPIFSKIKNLQSQQVTLRQMRDKLLPRLLGGELSLSAN